MAGATARPRAILAPAIMMWRWVLAGFLGFTACSGDDAARPDGGPNAECTSTPPDDAAVCPSDCPQGQCTGSCRQACGAACVYCRTGSWMEVSVNCACGGRRDGGS